MVEYCNSILRFFYVKGILLNLALDSIKNAKKYIKISECGGQNRQKTV